MHVEQNLVILGNAAYYRFDFPGKSSSGPLSVFFGFGKTPPEAFCTEIRHTAQTLLAFTRSIKLPPTPVGFVAFTPTRWSPRHDGRFLHRATIHRVLEHHNGDLCLDKPRPMSMYIPETAMDDLAADFTFETVRQVVGNLVRLGGVFNKAIYSPAGQRPVSSLRKDQTCL